MILPLTVFAGTAVAIVAKKLRTKERSPQEVAEDRVIYEACLNDVKDSDKLRFMANEFEKKGLVAEAAMLRKRADLRDAPVAVRKERKAIYKQAMRSRNKEAILEVAQEFENIAATSAADDLRKHAASLNDNPIQNLPIDDTAKNEVTDGDQG